LLKTAARLFPDFQMVWLGEETERNLPVELDFLNEGRNIEKVAKMLEKHKYVKVPKVYWDYSSDRILTMEYCEGMRADNLEQIKKEKINPNRVNSKRFFFLNICYHSIILNSIYR
jgi:aarF domain-containing kinase